MSSSIASERRSIRASFTGGIEITTKVTFLAAAPFLVYGFSRHLIDVAAGSSFNSARTRAFALGFVALSVLWFTFLRRIQFFATFEHELTHLLFGLLFLKRPHSIHAYDSQGMVRMTGHNFIIGLAPYTFPTLSYALIALGWLFGRPSLFGLNVLIGAATAFHLFTTIDETRPHQPDLRREGLVFSWIFIGVANLVLYGGICVFVLRGLRAFARYWPNGGRGAWSLLARLTGFE